MKDQLEPHLLDLLESGDRLAWLPLEDDRDMVLAIIAELGVDEAVELWRRFTTHWTETPLVKPIVDAAVRVFGVDFGTLARLLARFYSVEYRGMGMMQIQVHDDGASMTVRDMPAAMFEGDAYLTVFRGMATGFSDLTNAGLHVASWEQDPKAGALRLHLRPDE